MRLASVGQIVRGTNKKNVLRLLLLALAANRASADPQPEAVTVTATRVSRPIYDVPAAIDVVPGSNFSSDTLGVNLAEGLNAVPGLLARDRENYAQDEQISVRGFGARSQFGVRGVRLYLDDIPATQPDGQGQVSHFNLGSADRVEVLRGPFSALYGNSSGGVISMYTADGRSPPVLNLSAEGGSYGIWHTNMDALGQLGPVDYNVDYSHFSTDGYRPHARATRDSGNGKFSFDSAAGKFTLVLNYLSSPESQDALGLTSAQFEADPRQTASVAAMFNTRKSVEQFQLGLIYDYDLSATQSLRILGYYGERQVRQFLSIPVSSQAASPTSSGGVVNLDNGYAGTDARWTWHRLLAGGPFSLVGGLSYDELSQHRRGYNNYVGDGSEPDELGQQGTLRRNENNDVYDLDEYLQADWAFATRWSASLGVRHSMMEFDSHDHFIQLPANGNDSGSKGYYATTPAGGILFKLRPWTHLYASYGDGFESPTLNELAYRADGGAGLNFALKPSHSDNGELGAKFRLTPQTHAQLALFQTQTRNEIVVGPTANGRNTYVNAPHTRRRGIEAAFDTRLARQLALQLSYTYVDAVVRGDGYCVDGTQDCFAAAPPAGAQQVLPGNRVPGVPEQDAYAALRFGGNTGWHTSINAQYASTVPTNDVNTVHAPSYALLGWDGGYAFDLTHWRINAFVRVDNLLDTAYVGSVIVNDGNGRYFETGFGRAVLAGASFNWKY